MAELMQGHDRGEDRGERQSAEVEPEERPQHQCRKYGKADLAERMLEPAALAILTGSAQRCSLDSSRRMAK
ncbi:hypothetical protein MesoLj113c_37680 [Mesorhizobium sp. 113-3-9]|nr:hypothetical protein MesoLj113c_37680 [Mesorhizobium sp. 113-3-9]